MSPLGNRRWKFSFFFFFYSVKIPPLLKIGLIQIFQYSSRRSCGRLGQFLPPSARRSSSQRFSGPPLLLVVFLALYFAEFSSTICLRLVVQDKPALPSKEALELTTSCSFKKMPSFENMACAKVGTNRPIAFPTPFVK